jgi:dipeptidyl aminopeptidase/acylaminoacyl peptidase
MKLATKLRTLAYVGTLALVGASPAQAQRPMTIVDLINVPSVSDPQLSPKGSQILYARSDADWKKNNTVSHIWRVNADGSNAIQLTSGPEGESNPRWSPDGSRIAFLTKRGDVKETQIYLIRNDGGEALPLTSHATAVSNISWSPDGSWIYFLAPDEKTPEEKAREKINDNVFAFDEDWKHRHLCISVDAGTRERITQGDFTVRDYQLSRDGSRIVHHRSPTPQLDDGQLSEIWIMGAAGAEARQLTDNRIAESRAELSPDGSRILFVANSNQEFEFYYNDKLFLMPASGGAPTVLLPELPHEVNAASWSADGRSIFFLANTGVRQELFEVEVASRRVTQLTRGDHTVSSWSYEPAVRRHAFIISTPTDGGEVWTLDGSRRSQPRQVTNVFGYLTREFRLPRVEAIQWQGEDGVTVEGLLFYPLDYREGERYPLVVQTHGGPAASDKFSWHGSSNYVPVLNALGYMVLKPNYRGSTGYGDDFLRNMVGQYFNQAHKDVMTGVDYLIARGLVDGERMAKMGWSAGGHMTNKIITYTDRFKAASSGAGAINWVSMYGQSDTRVYRTPWFGGTPWQENAPIERYIADSPLFEIHKVKTPTLVLVGQNDERVPMSQSVELYRALKANGVPTRLYVAPRQGHGWRELQQRLFKANAELDWFERWVRNREYSWERSPVHEPSGEAVATSTQESR